MKVKTVAGSLISCDVLVEIELNDELDTDEVIMESPSILQYGSKMRAIIDEELKQNRMEKPVTVRIVDKGAMDYVLRARVQTAFSRLRSLMGKEGK